MPGSTQVDWAGQEIRKQDAKPHLIGGDHEWATAIEGVEEK
jgi:hypothetical protein